MPEIADIGPAVERNTTHVGVLPCDSYDEAQLERKLIEGFELFGGIGKYIGTGDKVFVKPNFLVVPRTPDDPAITHPALLYSLCKIIRDVGARAVIGDSPAFGTVQKVLRKLGYEDRMKRLGVELIQLKKSVNIDRTINGEKKRFVISKDVLDSDFLINVPKLKVHCQLAMSLAIKNLFGCVPGKRKAWRHMSYGDRDNAFAHMIAETYIAVSPGFTILDAIISMERAGPRKGDPRTTGLLFLGEDCVAIETVVLKILGVDPRTVPVYQAAVALGVGEKRLERIKTLPLSLDEIGPRELVPSSKAPIRFSIPRVIRSVLKNLWISKIKKS